jgi:hypothetical protein
VSVPGAAPVAGRRAPWGRRTGLRLVDFSGPYHRRLLSLPVVFGALFLVVADTLARTVLEQRELQVGIITAIIRVPVVFARPRRTRRHRTARSVRRETARPVARLEQNATPSVDLSVREVVLLGRIPEPAVRRLQW